MCTEVHAAGLSALPTSPDGAPLRPRGRGVNHGLRCGHSAQGRSGCGRNAGCAGRHVRARLEAGVLTLDGQVDSRVLKVLAEQAARAVPGVRAIRNLIQVVSPVRLSDVRRRIRAAFARDAAARGFHVEAAIEGGVVTLKG